MGTNNLIYDYVISGALLWGGPICKQSVSVPTRISEFLFWNGLIIFSFLFFGINKWMKQINEAISKSLSIQSSTTMSKFEFLTSRILSFVHFGMFLHLIYFKINSKGLICLTQPCHMILLLEGIALYYHKEPLGTLMSIYLLPSLIGTILAMVCPDTSGLDQLFERESYWIQHYLICAPIPLFLLCRNNLLAAKSVSMKSIIIGTWFLAIAHWTLFDPIDYLFEVNVEFMLCPSSGMQGIFDGLPLWLKFPSYRTTITIVVCLISVPLSFGFIFLSKIFEILFSPLMDSTTTIKKKSY